MIYELHVRGFTKTHPDIPPDIRGTFAGLGHPAAIGHLTRLGITTVELMPSAAWIDERHLPPLNLTNYWGYNPMAFLAPDPRLAPGGWTEIRAAVDALHAAGISVILDVVLNHTGESDEWGPTLSMRGLDNAGYYRLAADRSRLCQRCRLRQHPGDGPSDRRAPEHGCAAGLGDVRRPGRVPAGPGGHARAAATAASTAMRRSWSRSSRTRSCPRCVMIAEPWDIGPGGYQLGAFPGRWGEWNDRYRDTVRRFWRGDAGMLGDFTTRFAGSADVFGPDHRPVTRSINYITAHDGFTLADLVAYNSKHNAANGEDNRDGSNDNQSWNNGVEGPSDDPAILAARAGDVRALLATLLLSRGTPMLSMGDEAGRTQHGNNNAYAQDNASSWMDWSAPDESLIDFTARLIALRHALAPLFDGRELQGRAADDSAVPDVTWFSPEGHPLTEADWRRDSNRTLVAALYANGVRAALVFHADAAVADIVLPPPRPGHRWRRVHGQRRHRSHRQPGPSGADRLRSSRRVASSGRPERRQTRFPTASSIGWRTWPASIRSGGTSAAASTRSALDTKRALLAAMRLPADTRSNLADSVNRLLHERDAPLPPVVIGRADEAIKVKLGTPRPAWITLLREDGSRERFPAVDGTVVLPPQPIGRHRLLNEDRPERFSHLTVAPHGCYLPPALLAGERRFGIAAHLYSLRSNGDQGIGDFTTLKRLSAEAARNGASLIGLNPLHALFPHDREPRQPVPSVRSALPRSDLYRRLRLPGRRRPARRNPGRWTIRRSGSASWPC